MEIQQDIAITISKDAFKVLEEFNRIGALKNQGKIGEAEYGRRIYVEILKIAQLRVVAEEAMNEGAEFSEDQIGFLDDLYASLSEEADIATMDDLKKEDIISVRNFVRKYDNIVSTKDLEEDLNCWE